MGYITRFDFKISNCSEKMLSGISNFCDREELDAGYYLKDFRRGAEFEWSGEAKWYDFEEDMIKITKEFPVVVLAKLLGEDQDESEYFIIHNGKIYNRYQIVSWPTLPKNLWEYKDTYNNLKVLCKLVKKMLEEYGFNKKVIKCKTCPNQIICKIQK